jgi:hypothetical protein
MSPDLREVLPALRSIGSFVLGRTGFDVITAGEAGSRAAAVPTATPVNWSSLITREWFSPCMAADWVRMAFLAPAAALEVSNVATHTSGSGRDAILDVIPTFQDLCLFLNQHRPGRGVLNSTHRFADQLAEAFVTPSWVDAPAFWGFAAHFLLSFQVPRKTQHGTVVFTDKRGHLRASSSKMGLGVCTGTSTPKGRVVKRLWGSLFALSAEDVLIFKKIWGASTHSIVQGESDVQHLLLGPLALVNSRCAAHST